MWRSGFQILTEHCDFMGRLWPGLGWSSGFATHQCLGRLGRLWAAGDPFSSSNIHMMARPRHLEMELWLRLPRRTGQPCVMYMPLGWREAALVRGRRDCARVIMQATMPPICAIQMATSFALFAMLICRMTHKQAAVSVTMLAESIMRRLGQAQRRRAGHIKGSPQNG
jgi:hypothetical protein